MEMSKEVGYVVRANDYLVHIEGLPGAKIHDLITSDYGIAMVESLNGWEIRALMLNNHKPKPGEMFISSENGLRLPVAKYLIGRAINPLGIPIDGKAAVPFGSEKLIMELTAPAVNRRCLIDEQFYTGFSITDSILPIGKGQRQLIIGDARSGKSGFILDTIAAQKERNIICIYAALGKSDTEIKRAAQRLFEAGAADFTIIIGASSSEPAPLIAIAPDVALTIGEFFNHHGQDVLIVFDDLGLHAKYLREINLLSREIPGRESYPGDIFYAQSRLMERSGKFKSENGNFSITLLPVIETELENNTALIPTNLMSQTDGHLLFSSTLSAAGRYPSIDWSRSVTRVGRQVQNQIQKLVSSRVRFLLAEYQNLKTFSKFEAEISPQSQEVLERAEMVLELLNQERGGFVDWQTQTILLTLPFTKFFAEKKAALVKEKKNQITDEIAKAPKLRAVAAAKFETFESFVSALEAEDKILGKICQ